MEDQKDILNQYRPAELWRLMHPSLAFEASAYRDTLLYLLSCSALRIRVVRKQADKYSPVKVPFVYIEPGANFDLKGYRFYELPILEFMAKVKEKELLLRYFMLDFAKSHGIGYLVESIRQQMIEDGLIRPFGILRFSKPKKGRIVRARGKKLIKRSKEIGNRIRNKQLIKADAIKPIFRELGHHLVLLDEFPFAKLKKLGNEYAAIFDHNASFFDDESLDLPDLRVLTNIKAIDRVFYDTFKPGSQDFDRLLFPH